MNEQNNEWTNELNIEYNILAKKASSLLVLI